MRAAIAGLTLLSAAMPAQGASIGVISFAGTTPIISLAGPIEAGDDIKFDEFAQALRNPAIVQLSSYGGNTLAALAIGRQIARLGYTTYVGNGEVCASACGLIWLAGKTRWSGGTSQIGLHATYVNKNGVNVAIPGGNALVGKYLGELGFRDEFVVYATSAEPDEMSWLNRGITNLYGISWEVRDQDAATIVTINVGKADPPVPVATSDPEPALAPKSPLPEPKRVYTETIRPNGTAIDSDAVSRVQGERAQAEARLEAEKQRFIDKMLEKSDPPPNIVAAPTLKSPPKRVEVHSYPIKSRKNSQSVFDPADINRILNTDRAPIR